VALTATEHVLGLLLSIGRHTAQGIKKALVILLKNIHLRKLSFSLVDSCAIVVAEMTGFVMNVLICIVISRLYWKLRLWRSNYGTAKKAGFPTFYSP
jgi:hypothetical protein